MTVKDEKSESIYKRFVKYFRKNTDKDSRKQMNIGAQSFAVSIGVIFLLMVFAYILTFIIPGGHYTRIENDAGNMVIDKSIPFQYVEGGIPFWKWILSPFLVLGSSGNTTLIAVMVFLLVIGGIFSTLTECGLMEYALKRIAAKSGLHKYRLLSVIIFFFMAMGSLIGSFEECVPLVPITVGLSLTLGWDRITGVAMSILAAGCGFSAGVFNPFTVGVAQQLAGLPMFSGVSLRILSFFLIYALLLFMVISHARKVERHIEAADTAFKKNAALDRGLIAFSSILGAGIVLVLCSGFIPAIRDYTLIIVAVMFMAAGITASFLCGNTAAFLGKTFSKGALDMCPAVLMIMMASSIKYILETANVMDSILYGSVKIAEMLPGWAVILFIYLIVLVMNFFIPSGSAKAFMLIPIIAPLAQVFNIPVQLCIVAFAFGDGFSNVLYPTNPALLISLGLARVSYAKWFRWSSKFQLANLVITSAVLLFGLAADYGM